MLRFACREYNKNAYTLTDGLSLFAMSGMQRLVDILEFYLDKSRDCCRGAPSCLLLKS